MRNNIKNIVFIKNIFLNRLKFEEKVTIRGWVRSKRSSKLGLSFIMVSDGSSLHPIQVIAKNNLHNYYNEILKISTGCSVSIDGIIAKSLGKEQTYELHAIKIKIVGMSAHPERYPISAKQHTLTYLRKFAHLRARTKLIGAISRVRHVVSSSLHSFFNKMGYIWVPTPIITSFDTEGNSQMFKVSTINSETKSIKHKKEFFKKNAFLTVSGQLNLESYACSISNVYTFGPVFRAEYSDTRRHLAEFWMLESESAFKNLNDIVILAEDMLKYVFKKILSMCADEICFYNNNVIEKMQSFIKKGFLHLEYCDAISILTNCKKYFKKPIYWGIDLSPEHEAFLTDKYFNSILIIKNHPKAAKAFYMRINNDQKTVASMDVLAPKVGEIIGGSQREERLEALDIRMKEFGLDKTKYWWYRDLRKYGTVPHAGFGLGLERLIAFLAGIDNVKDAIPFPRAMNMLDF